MELRNFSVLACGDVLGASAELTVRATVGRDTFACRRRRSGSISEAYGACHQRASGVVAGSCDRRVSVSKCVRRSDSAWYVSLTWILSIFRSSIVSFFRYCWLCTNSTEVHVCRLSLSTTLAVGPPIFLAVILGFKTLSLVLLSLGIAEFLLRRWIIKV